MVKVTFQFEEDKKKKSTKILRIMDENLSDATEAEKVAVANVLNAFDKALENLDNEINGKAKDKEVVKSLDDQKDSEESKEKENVLEETNKNK